jgi:hypothetical protein
MSPRPAPGSPQERTEVAPIVYACGASFTTFVVDRIGVRETIGLLA